MNWEFKAHAMLILAWGSYLSKFSMNVTALDDISGG